MKSSIQPNRDPRYNLHCHSIGGHGLCRIIKDGRKIPDHVTADGTRIEGCIIEGPVTVEFEDGHLAEVHGDMLRRADEYPLPAPDPHKN